MAKISLKQLAAELDMSASSVSEILNRKSKKYKAETVDRVFKAASKHNYLPNIAANMMLSKKYNSIALVMSFPDQRGFITDSLIQGIQAQLSERDYHLVLAPLSDNKLTNDKYMPKFLKTWMVDGVLVLYWQSIPDRLSELIEKYEIPAIWINCQQKYNCVYIDYFKTVSEITNSLIQLGHRSISYADYTHGKLTAANYNHFSVKERWDGYESTMKAAGLFPKRFGSCGYIAPKKRMDDALEQFKKKDVSTAIIASYESTAVPIYCAALKAGINVPDDLSIITFGESSKVQEGFPITTLLLPWHEIGFRASELLCRQIDHSAEKYLNPVVLKIETNKSQLQKNEL